MTVTQTRPPDTHQPSSEPAQHAVRIPPLENGDRLTRAEFRRRYEAMPHLKKAELVEGVVYVGSPVRIRAHARPHLVVAGWALAYIAATPGVDAADNGTAGIDADNEYQPDVSLRIDEDAGGQSHLVEDYVEGPPELVVEVAASSVSIDRHTKMHVYRRAGVKEYVLWQTLDRRVEWFALREGEYVPLEPDERGVIHSQVFPGLRLHVPALLENDLATVLAELQAGMASAEHEQFVKTLAERRLAAGAQPGAAGR
jgi:Uma2 family endonuclease